MSKRTIDELDAANAIFDDDEDDRLVVDVSDMEMSAPEEPEIPGESDDPDDPDDGEELPGPGPRSRRGKRRRIRRRAGYVAGVILVVGLGVFLVGLLSRHHGTSAAPSKNAPAVGGPSATLTLFVVQDDPPLAAVIGNAKGRPAQIVPMPSTLLAAMPRAGSGTTAEALAVSGSFARLSISNVLGTWIDHYVVLDDHSIGKIVSDRGGLTVNLPDGARLGDQVYPTGGETKLTGAQVVEYLTAAKGDERALRWQEVLVPLFADGVSLQGVQVVATDNQDAVSAALASAKSPELGKVPTLPGEGGYLRPDNPGIRDMLATTFGIDNPQPFSVIVLNGTTRQTAADGVTEQLVPAGYRVAAFGPARGVNHNTTLIIASVDGALPQAQRMQKVLGVGRVFLGGQESGIGDITVIIGKDALRA
jgi:hypothetical protein